MPKKVPKKYFVSSDGVHSTISDGEGNEIENVVDAVVRMEPYTANTLELTIALPEVNVVVRLETVFLKCPLCEGYEAHECDAPGTSAQEFNLNMPTIKLGDGT
jgi:hypothetical protein